MKAMKAMKAAQRDHGRVAATRVRVGVEAVWQDGSRLGLLALLRRRCVRLRWQLHGREGSKTYGRIMSYRQATPQRGSVTSMAGAGARRL